MNNIPIFDGHNDTLVDLILPEHAGQRSFFEESAIGHIDLPRAKKGGLIGGFFAICTPPPESSPERDPFYCFYFNEAGYDSKERRSLGYIYANQFAFSVIDYAHQLEKQSGGKVKIVTNYAELNSCIEHDVLAMMLHIEGAEPIKDDLTDLEKFYQEGIRSLGLVWSRPNAFGQGVPYRYPHSPDIGQGLTTSGKKLVGACNELGIIIDLAHIAEKGFWDVAELSKYPLVVSHAAVHALCPSTRNITDRQIDAVGESGGVIGIWFEPVHIKYRTTSDGKPIEDVSLGEIVKHINYIANRIGVDHVALGSDFDGATMPKELRDAGYLPNLLKALRDSGHDSRAIEKIAYKNWLRVIKETWGI
jgi:membrane dipeptidase